MVNDAQQSQITSQVIIAVDGDHVVPANKLVFLTQKELTKLKWAASYWQAQYERVVKREELLKKELEEQNGLVRDLRQRLFGKKSEKGNKDSNPDKDHSKKGKRGAKKGSPGHGRTIRPELSAIKEELDIPLSWCTCRTCTENQS